MKNISLSKLFIGVLSIIGSTVFSPLFAHASGGFLITEIMYDPPGAESPWIEVYNSGSTPLDLSKYFLYTAGGGSTKHGIGSNKVGNGNTTVPAGGYAIIADDGVGFYASHGALQVVDSSFSISAVNSSTIILTTDTVKPPVTFDDQVINDPIIGGVNDGNSLQKTSAGNWFASIPTPGLENTATSSTTTTDTTGTSGGGGGTSGGGSGTSSSTTIAVAPKVVTPPHMQATITLQKIGSVGVAIPFSVTVLGYNGEQRYYGSFHTAFGDGTAIDTKGPEPFEHTYQFPGSYVVTFEYKGSVYDKKPEITARTKIEITVAGVVISQVLSDGSIEITNTSDREADLSDWSLQSGDVIYHIPSGTILLSSTKITLPIEITKFATPVVNPQLLLPSGVVFMKYGDTIAQPSSVITAPMPVYAKTTNTAPVVANYSASILSSRETASPEIVGDALSANAVGSLQDEIDISTTKKRSVWPYIFAIIGIIVGAIIALLKFGGFPGKVLDSERESSTEENTKSIADNITIIDE